jgi:hypothetical protein
MTIIPYSDVLWRKMLIILDPGFQAHVSMAWSHVLSMNRSEQKILTEKTSKLRILKTRISKREIWNILINWLVGQRGQNVSPVSQFNNCVT